MNRAFLPLIAFALIALVLISGCPLMPEVQAIEELKKDPAASDFLAVHPNAVLSTEPWSQEQSQQRISELVEKCGPSISAADFYHISFQDGDARLEGWVSQSTMGVVCVYRNDYQCVTASDCEDGLLCTADTCDGIPKQCSRERIKTCVGGDSCCPEGCTFSVDFDCEIGECNVHEDCDDGNPATEDTCIGMPKKCENEFVTECGNNDDYCPEGCNYNNDADCPIVTECEIASDCDDAKASTRDYCRGTPKLCSYEEITECIDFDGYCPVQCYDRIDSDCVATAGNRQRIIVNCNGFETDVDADIMNYENELKASFNAVVSYANNDGLLLRSKQGYKYNGLGAMTSSSTPHVGIESRHTTIIERIRINARAIYDKETKESFLYFNRDGLQYEVDLVEGIPARQSEVKKDDPFVSGNDDEIAIVLFGTDSFVSMVNQNEGEQEVELVSDYTELVGSDSRVAWVDGKNKENYFMRVDQCYEDRALFTLRDIDKAIALQTASAGDIMFPDYLAETVRINYLNRDYSTGKCDYRYAKGPFLEKLYHGEAFPLGRESDWTTSLEFDNNRLKKIALINNENEEQPLETGEDIWLVKNRETAGYNFCKLHFSGLVR